MRLFGVTTIDLHIFLASVISMRTLSVPIKIAKNEIEFKIENSESSPEPMPALTLGTVVQNFSIHDIPNDTENENKLLPVTHIIKLSCFLVGKNKSFNPGRSKNFLLKYKFALQNGR